LRQPAGLVSPVHRWWIAFLAERASGTEGEPHFGHDLTQHRVVGYPHAQNLLGRQLPDDAQGVAETFYLRLGLPQTFAAAHVLFES
jgi:hypothetical protein